MLDGWIRIKDIRPFTDGRSEDGEWRFHRNSAYNQWKRILTTNTRNEKARLKTGPIRYGG